MNIIDQDKLGNNFKEKLVQESDDIIRELILLLLSNNLGASYEKVHDSKLATIAWMELTDNVEEMIKLNPSRALGIALFLVMLPVNNNENLEWKYRYLRGDGLSILMNESLTSLLQSFLGTSWAGQFASTLLAFINYPIENWSYEEAVSTPEFYSTIVALKVGINLRVNSSSELAIKIFNAAKARLSNSRVKEQIGWYLSIPDTKDLAESLLTNT
jgi:hypothetical protein